MQQLPEAGELVRLSRCRGGLNDRLTLLFKDGMIVVGNSYLVKSSMEESNGDLDRGSPLRTLGKPKVFEKPLSNFSTRPRQAKP